MHALLKGKRTLGTSPGWTAWIPKAFSVSNCGPLASQPVLTRCRPCLLIDCESFCENSWSSMHQKNLSCNPYIYDSIQLQNSCLAKMIFPKDLIIEVLMMAIVYLAFMEGLPKEEVGLFSPMISIFWNIIYRASLLTPCAGLWLYRGLCWGWDLVSVPELCGFPYS